MIGIGHSCTYGSLVIFNVWIEVILFLLCLRLMSYFSRLNFEICCIISVKYNPIIDTGAQCIIRLGQDMHASIIGTIYNWRKIMEREHGKDAAYSFQNTYWSLILCWPGCQNTSAFLPHWFQLGGCFQDKYIIEITIEDWDRVPSTPDRSDSCALPPGRPLNCFYSRKWPRNLVWPRHRL